MFTKTGQEHHGSQVGKNQKSKSWCRCVLVAAWEIIEIKGKQDGASKSPDSKMVGSLMSDPCSSKQLLLLSEAKNREGLMGQLRFICKVLLVEVNMVGKEE